MKKYSAIILCLILALSLCLSSCGKPADTKGMWESATYNEDTELGSGKKTVVVEVTAEDKSVSFTINTDKSTLGDALMEHKLVSGEKGAYGLYIKVVNGMEADYNKTKSYWSLNKDSESLPHGADSEKITDGAHYEIVCIKE